MKKKTSRDYWGEKILSNVIVERRAYKQNAEIKKIEIESSLDNSIIIMVCIGKEERMQTKEELCSHRIYTNKEDLGRQLQYT